MTIFRTPLIALAIAGGLLAPATAAALPPPHSVPGAAPQVANACEVVKAARVSHIVGPVKSYLPLVNSRDANSATTMCAFESENGRHYGVSIRQIVELPDNVTPQKLLNRTIELRLRADPDTRGLRQPNIGEAALWDRKQQQLTVWLHDGTTKLVFLGDKSAARLHTQLAIARRVMAHLR